MKILYLSAADTGLKVALINIIYTRLDHVIKYIYMAVRFIGDVVNDEIVLAFCQSVNVLLIAFQYTLIQRQTLVFFKYEQFVFVKF